MSKVIPFQTGQKLALYTDTHMYVGTTDQQQDFIGRPGIWLLDVAVMPIRGQVNPDEVLRLGSVCVLWDKIVAVGGQPDIGSVEYH